MSCLDPFVGAKAEKNVSIYHGWRKERPAVEAENLLFLVYSIESLDTHETDLVILLNNYNPHVCVLTGVGTASRRNLCATEVALYHFMSRISTWTNRMSISATTTLNTLFGTARKAAVQETNYTIG